MSTLAAVFSPAKSGELITTALALTGTNPSKVIVVLLPADDGLTARTTTVFLSSDCWAETDMGCDTCAWRGGTVVPEDEDGMTEGQGGVSTV